MLDSTPPLQHLDDLSLDFGRIVGDGLMTGSTASKSDTLVLALILDTAKKQGATEAFEAAKKLIELNPNSIGALVSFYNIVRNSCASSRLGKQVANEYTKIANAQMSLLCDYFRTPPIHITGWMLGRIGEAADQTAGVVKAQRLGLLKYRPVMCLTGEEKIANRAFIPYLKDAFDIITSSEEVRAFKSQRVLPRFDSYLMRFSDEIYGHASEYEAKLNTLLDQNKLPTNAFTLKETTTEVALSFLKDYDINDDDDFVTLHIREPGYADAKQHSERNAHPQNYQKAIDYLIAQGIKIVRIGHEKMSELKSQKGFIDLTKASRPDEVDIFLCASNRFYFGSSSGPYSISYQFGKPSLLSELVPFWHARPNGLNDMKQFYDSQTRELANFDRLKNLDLGAIFAREPYNKSGLESCRVTENDILKSAKEMLGIDQKSGIITKNKQLNNKKNSLEIDCNVMFTSRSLELFS